MSNLDMILFQIGPDDGENTTFYTFVVDPRDPDSYRGGRGNIVDRFNNLTWDKFFEIDKLALDYVGPKNGFMKKFGDLSIYSD